MFSEEPNQPILKLPNRLVVDSPTLYDSDFLTCTANIGYRQNINIRFEYYLQTTSNFVTFDLGAAKAPVNNTENCTTELIIRREAILFDSSWDNVAMRCVLYDTDTGTMVMHSAEQTIHMIDSELVWLLIVGNRIM